MAPCRDTRTSHCTAKVCASHCEYGSQVGITTKERVSERGGTTEFFSPSKIKSLQIINHPGFLLQTPAEKALLCKRNKSHSTPRKSVLQESDLENAIAVPWNRRRHGGMPRPRDGTKLQIPPWEGRRKCRLIESGLKRMVVVHQRACEGENVLDRGKGH